MNEKIYDMGDIKRLIEEYENAIGAASYREAMLRTETEEPAEWEKMADYRFRVHSLPIMKQLAAQVEGLSQRVNHLSMNGLLPEDSLWISDIKPGNMIVFITSWDSDPIAREIMAQYGVYQKMQFLRHGYVSGYAVRLKQPDDTPMFKEQITAAVRQATDCA